MTEWQRFIDTTEEITIVSHISKLEWPMETIEINPNTPACGSVIWLHGLGADGADFAPIVQQLNLPATLPLRFIFPHAPVRPITINGGYPMRAWYDISSAVFQHQHDWEGIDATLQQVNAMISAEIARGIPANKIILAGFSQGAVITLLTGLRSTQQLGGLLALSGYLPTPAQCIAHATHAAKQTPIFIAHGTQDTLVNYEYGEQAARALQQNGFNITWQHYPMAHTVCAKEIADIAAWLQKIG